MYIDDSIMMDVFEFLNPIYLFKCLVISKKWNALINKNYLWESKLKNKFKDKNENTHIAKYLKFPLLRTDNNILKRDTFFYIGKELNIYTMEAILLGYRSYQLVNRKKKSFSNSELIDAFNESSESKVFFRLKDALESKRSRNDDATSRPVFSIRLKKEKMLQVEVINKKNQRPYFIMRNKNQFFPMEVLLDEQNYKIDENFSCTNSCIPF